jgi:phosphoserine phosphatase RsbU/P
VSATETPVRDRVTVPGATILVVDDSPVNLQVIVRTLDGRGHRILAAKSGRAGLDIARRARPDLVLLDIMMPDIDGFEVCRALKADPLTRDALVIFLSALGEVADKVAGLSAGAVDYVTKPIQPEEVLARVDGHLARLYLERELRQSRDRLDLELENAAEMQRLILPRTLPARGRVRFFAYYRTSRHAGGDYYDVLTLPDDRFGVIVADVSGHGAPAAIVMAMIRAVLHTYPGPPADPAIVLDYVNSHFRVFWETALFATAIYAVIDAKQGGGLMQMACAGHPPPLLLRKSAGVTSLSCDPTIPLLFERKGQTRCADAHLEAGDRVLFYTDGITDRDGPGGAMYELDRLTSVLERHGSEEPPTLLQLIVKDLDAFAAGHEPFDDQTLLLMAFD